MNRNILQSIWLVLSFVLTIGALVLMIEDPDNFLDITTAGFVLTNDILCAIIVMAPTFFRKID